MRMIEEREHPPPTMKRTSNTLASTNEMLRELLISILASSTFTHRALAVVSNSFLWKGL